MQDQIKELLERYIKGECTGHEIFLLEKWYDRVVIDEGQGRLVDEVDEERLVRAFWEAIAEKEKGKRGTADEEADPAAGKRQMTIGHRNRIWRYAAVWTGLIVVSGGIWLQWNRRMARPTARKQPVFTEIITGYQQVRKVLLPDSSVVWLNSATRLSFDPEFTTHRLVLLSGEAFFEVTPDAQHPFVVKAGNVSTRVFGTAFNISAYPAAGELRVSLKSGKVGVEYQGNLEKVLRPGELLVYDKQSGDGQTLQQAPGEMDEWTGGRLLFYKTPIREALAQIEARYGVHIVFDRVLEDRDITARFDNTALEKVLQSLSFGWNLHFVRNGSVLHVR
jgi:transmembrane sensor